MNFNFFEKVRELNAEALYPTGFEECIVGMAQRDSDSNIVFVLSKKRCIELLMARDNMNEDDADEHFEYNIAGSWLGVNTPMFSE